MALFTELSIHKTKKGYRLFRSPIETIKTLRDSCIDIILNDGTKNTPPYEVEFTLLNDRDARVQIGNAWFEYDSDNHKINTSSKKCYEICSDNDLFVRIIVDTRSAEVYLQDEITMSFFVKQAETKVECENSVKGKLYTLKSIWDENV